MTDMSTDMGPGRDLGVLLVGVTNIWTCILHFTNSIGVLVVDLGWVVYDKSMKWWILTAKNLWWHQHQQQLTPSSVMVVSPLAPVDASLTESGFGVLRMLKRVKHSRPWRQQLVLEVPE